MPICQSLQPKVNMENAVTWCVDDEVFLLPKIDLASGVPELRRGQAVVIGQ